MTLGCGCTINWIQKQWYAAYINQGDSLGEGGGQEEGVFVLISKDHCQILVAVN